MLQLLALTALVALNLMGCAEEKEEPNPQSALGDQLRYYVMAQEALAEDDLDEAGRSLMLMWEHTPEPLRQQVSQAAKAADLSAMRQLFSQVSTAMGTQSLPAGYGLAFCPMANNDSGAYWIQKKGDIANPYFGSSMLRCGVFKEKM